MQATISNIQDIASDLRIIFLNPEKKFKFKAGQYLKLSVNNLDKRPYSIANAPSDDNVIELHIRKNGQISTYLCEHTNINDEITIEGPFGECTYKAQCKKPMIAVAAGTGLAQIKPLVEKSLSTNRENPVYLYHGATDTKGLYLDTHFKNLSQKDKRLIYRPIVSEQPSDNNETKYNFLIDHIKNDFDNLKSFRAYMSGNPEIINSLKDTLLAKDIDPNRIHSDC